MDAFLRYATAVRPLRPAEGRSSLRSDDSAAGERLSNVAHLLIEPENVLYDGTLWPRWLWQVLSHMGVKSPLAEFFVPWQAQFRKEVDLGRRDYWDAFRNFLAHAGLTEAQIAEVMAAGVCRKKRFESERRCLPGVNETLRRLTARGISLHVLANTPHSAGDVLRELETMGLNGLFDGGATSRELQNIMPSTKCFRAALKRLSLDASRTVFISSRPRHLRGALRCGIQAIACNEDQPAEGAIALERFSDLCALLHPAVCTRAAG